jgi:hypothetical protein
LRRQERGVGRQRTDQIEPGRAQLFDRRDDRIDFLAAQMAASRRHAVQSEHGDARRGNAEAPDQIVAEDAQRAHEAA